MRENLFVFGSFADGMMHFKKIAPYVVETRAAWVRGSVYRLPSGMPVFLNRGTSLVSGHLVKLKNYDVLQTLLDEFHGFRPTDPATSLFFREEVLVEFAGEEAHRTVAYCINPEKLPANAKLIEEGNWLKSLTEKPTLLDQLTPKQRAYIQKLGSSSGRDIVPIDLQLYRELLNLEIVVDKGRRLALTPLGQEVFRFL